MQEKQVMKRYPMKLVPVAKDMIWGGTKLKDKYKKFASLDRIAESWELTVRDDGLSVIANGEYVGMTLGDYVKADPTAVGKSFDGTHFPLLIKFIDACDDLSIQVHPDDEYAQTVEQDSGKTEMWYIVDAVPGAEIIYGLSDGTGVDDFKSALRSCNIEGSLNRIKVQAGEVYFIPAGQVHAICHGVLIAEIQQNSNLTYRIYDYDRVDSQGKKRELHISKALDSVKSYSSRDIDDLRFCRKELRRRLPYSFKALCDCKYFRVSLAELKENGKASFTVDENSFASLLFTDAENTSVIACGNIIQISAGDSIFIPAGSGDVTICGSFKALISEC